MKAKIVPDLLAAIEAELGRREGHRESRDFLALCERIEGKIVSLKFTGRDAFEAIDNDWWLPESCWDPVPGAEP